jgi:hypothetical protein
MASVEPCADAVATCGAGTGLAASTASTCRAASVAGPRPGPIPAADDSDYLYGWSRLLARSQIACCHVRVNPQYCIIRTARQRIICHR